MIDFIKLAISLFSGFCFPLVIVLGYVNDWGFLCFTA